MGKKRQAYQRSLREIPSLKELMITSEALYGDKEAFQIKSEKGGPYRTITYRQWRRDVEALGTQLMEALPEGAKIAIIGDNCYQWVCAYFAIVNANFVAVPLDKELTEEEIRHLLETADCRGAFYTSKYKGYFTDPHLALKVRLDFYQPLPQEYPLSQEYEVMREQPEPLGEEKSFYQMVALGEEEIRQGNRRFIDWKVDPERLSVILFTSGTTGTAKGVMLCHRNIASNIYAASRLIKMYPQDSCLSILPIHHTLESTIGIMYMLYNGACIAFCEGLRYVSKNMEECRPTAVLLVPLIMETIYKRIWKQAEKTGKAALLKKSIRLSNHLRGYHINASRVIFRSVHEKLGGRLRMVVTGAASSDPRVCRGFMDFGITVIHGYGLTECAPLVSGCPDDSRDNYKKAGSVGPVISGGELKILKPDQDGIGEILYRGPNVMLGYFGQEEMTRQVLDEKGWFHTGDLGFLDPEGWLYLTGREKNVIVTKTGKNIYPEELEMVLNRDPYIEESLVYGRQEEEDTVVSAMVRPDYEAISEDFGQDVSQEDIQKLLKERIKELNMSLAVYKRIRDVTIRREDFVKTTTKKIRRFENLKEEEGQAKAEGEIG